MSLGLTEQIVIDQLTSDALDMDSVEYDWSEGYGEGWEFIEAPSCPTCDSYCRWDKDEFEWVCMKEGCEHYGQTVDPRDGYCEGPMMNYHYPLPDLGNAEDEYTAAEWIRDLPLCVIVWQGNYGPDYSLALTGGGMDLSWEICEAFMRLGFLPPVKYANLPGMAGKGDRPDERKVIEGCVRALTEWSEVEGRRSLGYADDAERLSARYLRGDDA